VKIDITQNFVNANDTPALDFETKKPITLKDILLQVCLAEGAKPDEKVKRWSLYRTIKKSKVAFVLLEAEEIVLLKKAVTETHSTLVVGQVHEMLETPYAEPPSPPVDRADSYKAVEG
jgi:hypothetical protein